MCYRTDKEQNHSREQEQEGKEKTKFRRKNAALLQYSETEMVILLMYGTGMRFCPTNHMSRPRACVYSLGRL